MSPIEVSLVIPTFNAERTIYMCLESIFLSDFPKEKLEVIVVDNNSTDESSLIAQQFDVQLLSEKRQGRSFARNTGIKAAKGQYVGFLDSDTSINKTWISEIVSVLSKGQIGGVAGQVKPSNIYGNSFFNKYRSWIIGKATNKAWNILYLKARESPMINSAACMYRKEALELVGAFDERLERHEDIDLSKRVLYAGYDLSVVDKAVAMVEYHGEGWISYFIRSFQDGLTKSDYLRKWKAEIELVDPTEEVITLNPDEITDRASTNLRDDSYQESKLSQMLKKRSYSSVYLIYTFKELVWDFYTVVRFLDLFHAIKVINDLLRIGGRVVGVFRPNIFGNKLSLNIRPKSERKRVVEFGKGKTLTVNDHIRFVLLADSYYLIDIRDHTILEDRAKAQVVYYVWLMLFKDFNIDFSDSCHESLFQEQDILEVTAEGKSERH